MVWQVANAVNIPVVGIGGIMNAADAIEFLLAGASVIQVGTAIFKDPYIPLEIVKGIEDYMDRHNIQNVSDLIGGLQV